MSLSFTKMAVVLVNNGLKVEVRLAYYFFVTYLVPFV